MEKLKLKVLFLRSSWISRKMKTKNWVQLIHKRNKKKKPRKWLRLKSSKRKLQKEMLPN